MSATVQLFRDIGPIKMAVMGVVAIAVFASIIFLSFRLSTPAVVPLFSNLDSQDSAKIASRLEVAGVYYEMRSGGAQIMVPQNKVLSVRMELARDGLPTAGATVGYEIFDKSDAMGVSSFVQNVNLVRALEGELGRTISSFDHVESARVHLVVPKEDLFSKRKQEPTASVVLQMRGNKPLSQSEITGISHLVATAVPGLDVQRITIVDTQGRPFKKGAAADGDPGVMASTSEEFRVQYERRMKNVIEDLLSRSVGMGRVEAQVSAEIDFDRIVTDSEIFDPDGQVARSIQSTEETGAATEAGGGGVSAANNLPGGDAANSGGGSSNTTRVDEVTNFEVSKTIKKHIQETGNVKRLSIAVLVDGIYNFDEETEEYNYTPRDENELKQLESLVRSAVGFQEDRGDTLEMINMRFSNDIQGVVQEKPFAWLTRDLGSIIQTLIIGAVVTLVILLIVKPMVGRAFEITKSESEEVELQAALVGQELEELAEITGQDEGAKKKAEALIDIDRFEEKMKSSSVAAINDIVDRHPNEAVIILRGWIESD